jgi:uncharacterized repeat protein (TIGR01451 family)
MKNKFLLKLSILIAILFGQNNSAKAQYVPIPDPNFVDYLIFFHPGCMYSEGLDTIFSQTVTYMNMNNKGINNLEGIKYFTNLETLLCVDNFLTFMPELPNSLIEIDCQSNQITLLPELPNSLKNFYCDGNQLTFIPELPDSLDIFSCGVNQLSFLPEIPNSLRSLTCSENQLISMPELPHTLYNLNCTYNQLTSLPEMPASLLYLSCQFNLLTTLPSLPNNIEQISCNCNQLTSLPVLPQFLFALNCSDNNISCFPYFPNSILGFEINDNPFTCLPNYINAMSADLLAYPLCQENDLLNNPNNCDGAKGIIGNIYKDINSNCSYNSLDLTLHNIPIKLYDESNNLISTIYALSNGIYNFNAGSGVYTILLDTINKPYSIGCNEYGVDTIVELDENNLLVDSINFAIACKLGIDAGVQSIYQSGLVFPGQPHQLNISAGDMLSWYNLNCASGTSGTVQINVTGSVAYTGTPDNVLVPDAIDGNDFTYNIADFGAIPLNSFGLLFLTDTTAQAGEEICVTASATPNGLDNDTSNNILTYCYPVVNSYDPNEKDVYPTSVLPNYDGYFTYTIHFQNTGTAPAINIKVQDTLSTNLDLSTFEITAYSHPNNTTLSGNLISFKLPNIWLPDSTSDLEGSKGFVQYRIKPIANLPVGTQITNTAYIYFDFNAPIQTNTTESNFEIIQSLKTYSKGKVSVYPNPNNGIFHINMLEKSTNEKTMELTNIVGEKVWSQKTKSNTATIDINHLPKGLYILNVTDNNSHYTERVVRN